MPPETGSPDRDEIVSALRSTPTVEAAAAVLGVHRVTLQRWMRELGVRREWVVDEEGATAAT